MSAPWNDQREWLETDGLGGFASGTVGGIATRRYHGLLATALNPPINRVMLLNALEVIVHTTTGPFALSSHRYDGEVVHPDGYSRITGFTAQPWPTWTYALPDGTTVEQQLFVRQDAPLVVMSWKASNLLGPATLAVRPLLSGRDMHALHRENGSFNFESAYLGGFVRWQPYVGLPRVLARTNGHYAHEPLWYRKFLYQEEWLRGFEAIEDLASPGSFAFELSGARRP
jgi:predicted glycogen debranching enzyme